MNRTDSGSSQPQGRAVTERNRGLRLGTVAGIEIRLDPSLLIIFMLLVYVLGGSVFPSWHPDWKFVTTWLTALLSGILFFGSVLAHELAHSQVAKRFGIPVPRITLFLFGGLAQIREEPETPGAEFLIAIAGPLISLALGLAFSFTGAALAGQEFAQRLADDPQTAMTTLSPAATLLLWLGPINIVLALFNLVPGFPLDGGRVLRAAVWWLTGDRHRATRAASTAGQMFGWFLMILGVLQALSGAVLQGLWLLLIGWFLSNTAAASYRQLVMHDIFRGVTARNLMRSRFETIRAQQSVEDFIDKHLLQSAQLLWPVIEDGRLVGLLTLQEVKQVPTADRDHTVVGQVMRTDLAQLTLSPDTGADQAMQELIVRDAPLAVIEGDKVVGLLSQNDTMKWLALHQA